MIAHEMKIGATIFDIHDMRWGEVLLINGVAEDAWLTDEDSIVTYRPVDTDGECEILAREAYPLKVDRYFWGEDVCMEINVDEFDDDHDYDFYCPERNENCWEFEVSSAY